MDTLKKTYHNIRTLVDGFAHSTSSMHSTLQKDEEECVKPWYAEKVNNYIGNLLDNALSKTCLRKIADAYYGTQLVEILMGSTELTSDAYPTLSAIYDTCGNRLGFNKLPKLYITGLLQGINALSLDIKQQRFILLSRMATILLSEQELLFVLGHELGHHQQGNLVCHTVNGLLDSVGNSSEIFGPLLADTFEVPMKRWCRQSEFNADRAGYICCGDIECIETLFDKIYESPVRSGYASLAEMYADHPFIQTRLDRIRMFCESMELGSTTKTEKLCGIHI